MCPPGVDQTCRTSAKWTILALGVRQKQKLPLDDAPYNFLADRASMDAFQRLYRLSHAPPLTEVAWPSLVDNNSKDEKKKKKEKNDGTNGTHEKNPLPSPPLSEQSDSLIPSSSSLLGKLPPELLSMVISNLDEDGDYNNKNDDDYGSGSSAGSEAGANALMALGLCSREYWHHVLRHIHSRYGQSGCWAGQPLICTSTWLTDVPDCIYKYFPELPGEIETWKERCLRARGGGTGRGLPSLRVGMNPVRRWNWDARGDWGKIEKCNPRDRLLGAFARQSAREMADGDGGGGGGRHLSAEVVAAMQDSLERVLLLSPSSMSSGRPWVLRNLDTWEYVEFDVLEDPTPSKNELDGDIAADAAASSQPEAVSDVSQDNDEPELAEKEKPKCKPLAIAGYPWVTPDFVLMAHIGWSDASDTRSEVIREQWAGHRFNMVEADYCNLQSGKWKNVTDKVLSKARKFRLSMITSERWTE